MHRQKSRVTPSSFLLIPPLVKDAQTKKKSRDGKPEKSKGPNVNEKEQSFS
jgi:hypothetical protein